MFARARLITLTAAVGAALAAPMLAAAPAWAALPGIQKPITVESRNDASFAKSATATCPNGKQLLGGTGLVVNGGSDVVLDGIKPTENSVTVEAVEDATGHPGQWKVQATAICANPVPGLERLTVQAQNSGSDSTETGPGVLLRRQAGHQRRRRRPAGRRQGGDRGHPAQQRAD